jgi:hypothetical protein
MTWHFPLRFVALCVLLLLVYVIVARSAQAACIEWEGHSNTTEVTCEKPNGDECTEGEPNCSCSGGECDNGSTDSSECSGGCPFSCNCSNSGTCDDSMCESGGGDPDPPTPTPCPAAGTNCSDWSSCSQSCGDGTRSRTCADGSCGTDVETEPCCDCGGSCACDVTANFENECSGPFCGQTVTEEVEGNRTCGTCSGGYTCSDEDTGDCDDKRTLTWSAPLNNALLTHDAPFQIAGVSTDTNVNPIGSLEMKLVKVATGEEVIPRVSVNSTSGSFDGIGNATFYSLILDPIVKQPW